MQTPTLKQPSWNFSKIACDALPAGWVEWVQDQAKPMGTAWLLAFALEGAAWGMIENGALRLADADFPGRVLMLKNSTLLELYVFSPHGQAHAWVEDGVWHASLLTDSQGTQGGFFDQELLLWGTRCPDENWKPPFALLVEGTQGMTQAVPLKNRPALKSERKHAPRLKVRNYLGQSAKNGAAYVAATRFVELKG